MALLKPRKLTIGSGLLLLINMGVLLLLVLGYLAAYIPPDKNWMFAFAGLIFPYAVVANVIFILIWLFLRRKLFWISLIALLICWNRLTNYIQINNQEIADSTKGNRVKIISYNVQIFDLYNWESNKISEKGHNILNLLKEEKPDLICLQEYHKGIKHKVDITDSIQQMTGLRYHQITNVVRNNKKMPYGIATFSRWPIIDENVIAFEDNQMNFCIFSDIVIMNDTVRLFNIHMESIRLSKEDYLYVTELPRNNERKEIFAEKSRKILRKFKRAYVSRAPQARKVAELIRNSPFPVIVCGDFNDTPSSYTYHCLSQNLYDAYKVSGNGIGQTYAGLLPSFRIDYIIHDKHYISDHFTTLKKKYSDHYPITTWITLK